MKQAFIALLCIISMNLFAQDEELPQRVNIDGIYMNTQDDSEEWRIEDGRVTVTGDDYDKPLSWPVMHDWEVGAVAGYLYFPGADYIVTATEMGTLHFHYLDGDLDPRDQNCIHLEFIQPIAKQ